MARTVNGVELLGAGVETDTGADKSKGRKAKDRVDQDAATSTGPTAGDDAPLFGVAPDLGCALGFEKGQVFVQFSRPTCST